ncbi:tRNA dimethylallyltransferase, mitochondrial [Microbotryomycetes sp. JL201]|nr:tRNA dimethylallyltransferase, mitochondrial [Microbotryomycetes sp. JL201]
MASQPSLSLPLIAVVGTTGVGKSLLGIELAKHLAHDGAVGGKWRSGEVINTDSMQVYQGLDIITNKATSDEMNGVPHHLMGFLDPGQEYRVGQFQQDALNKIKELHHKSVVPIAVGGTAYYLQHLVFPNQLVSDVPVEVTVQSTANKKSLDDTAHFPQDLKQSIMSLPAELLELFFALPTLPAISTPDEFPPSFPLEMLPNSMRTPEELTSSLYTLLKLVDPDSASRWHWRDIRKVRRALEIVWEGRRWNDVQRAQQQREAEAGGARFATLIFWLFADKDVLNPRLDSRIDKMIKLGLTDEIRQLWSIAQQTDGVHTDLSKGIFQAIGYKEFQAYLEATGGGALSESAHTRALFVKALDEMKTSTRQYAKRQVKWIRTKLLPAVRAAGNNVHIVLLDASDLTKWNENVRDVAIDIMKRRSSHGAQAFELILYEIGFLDGHELPEPAALSEVAATQLTMATHSSHLASTKIICETCTVDPSKPFMVEERQLGAHRKTRAHQRMAKPRDKRNTAANKARRDACGFDPDSHIEIVEVQSARHAPIASSSRVPAPSVLLLSDGDDDVPATCCSKSSDKGAGTGSDDELPPAFAPGISWPQRTTSLPMLQARAPRGLGSTRRTQSLNVEGARNALTSSALVNGFLAPVLDKGKQKATEPPSDATIDLEDSECDELQRCEATKTGKRKSAMTTESPPLKKRGQRLTEAEKEERKRKKEEEKTVKEAAKIQERVDKRVMLEANKLRVGDNDATTGELVVHLSGLAFRGPKDSEDEWDDDDDLFDSASARVRILKAKRKAALTWVEIGKLLEQRLGPLGCLVHVPTEERQDLGCEGALLWTRKCDRKWDDASSQFLPLGPDKEIVVQEDTRVIFMTALEISLLVATNLWKKRLKAIRQAIPVDCHVFLIHFGLQALCRQIDNADQAAYRQQVSGQQGSDGRATGGRAVGIGSRQPASEDIQFALEEAEVLFRYRIKAVDDVAQAVDWLEHLTKNVSQKPYQRLKMKHLSKLGSFQDGPSGKDGQDHMIKMVASIKGMTESLAKGVVREYKTFRLLWESWEACATDQERREMLVGIAKMHRVDGTLANRAIGKSTSESLAAFFLTLESDLYVTNS